MIRKERKHRRSNSTVYSLVVAMVMMVGARGVGGDAVFSRGESDSEGENGYVEGERERGRSVTNAREGNGRK